MKILSTYLTAWAFLLGLCLAPPATAADSAKPNILLVIADDMSWVDAGCYGNEDVKTPTIDQLAREGMRFTHCFTATAMCAPTRQQLYTGLFPVRNGAVANHSKVKRGTQSIVHHLKALGYTVVLEGKGHVGPRASFPFESQSLQALCEAEKPFCFIFASHHPHLPWNAGSAKYDPTTLTVPPYLLDTPETRKALVEYYKEITALDAQLKNNLDTLKAKGKDKNTLVLFTSEQGSAMPRAKWTCYDMGLRTALIARWPDRIQAGSTTDAIVRYVDVVPTLVQLAGGDPRTVDTGRDGAPDGGRGFDGSSFADVLLGKKDEHAQWTYGIQTDPGVHMLSVRSRTYKYIRNTQPGKRFFPAAWKKQPGINKMMGSWQKMAKNDADAKTTLARATHPPKEMLFAIDKDPYELNNLAEDPEYANVLAQMRKELAAWMKQQRDRR